MENNTCNYYIQYYAEINSRKVWHFLIDTPIGQINIVDYELRDKSIKRRVYDGEYDKAERHFENLCGRIAKNTA